MATSPPSSPFLTSSSFPPAWSAVQHTYSKIQKLPRGHKHRHTVHTVHTVDLRMNIAASMGGMGYTSAQFASGNREKEPSSAVNNATRFWDEGQCEANDFFDQFVVLDDTVDAASLNDTDNHSSGSSQHGGTCPTDASSVDPGPSMPSDQSCSFDFMSMAVPATAAATQHHHQLTDVSQYNAALARHNHNHHIGGAITDSELLRIEGLSMRSPRTIQPPASASSASVPTSPSLQPANRKQGRLENIYSTIRKAPSFFKRAGRQDQDGMQPMPMSTAQMSPGRKEPRGLNLGIDKSHMPLSPPLTSPMPDLTFLHGFMDDPFMDAGNASIQEQHIKANHTPLSTPLLDASGATGWAMQNATDMQSSDDAALWGFVSGENGWEANSGGANSAALNAKSATYNLTMQMHPGYDQQQLQQQQQQQQQQLANSGLVIQMPQPRNAGSGLVQDPAHQLPPGLPQLPSQYGHQAPQSFSQAYSEHRRKPRAPSSGARHHSVMTSPRKMREGSLGPSTSPGPATPSRGRPGGRIRRSTSLQGIGLGVGLGPPSDAAVRKRRSFSRTATRRVSTGGPSEPRTPGRIGSGSYAGSFESALEMEMEMDGMGLPEAGISLSDSPRKNGGGGQIGFVNFTPSDHNILMTGVAPSGSSKTKARREKEAAEKQRKLNEAVVKAVQAAGGDVQKLKEEGLVLG